MRCQEAVNYDIEDLKMRYQAGGLENMRSLNLKLSNGPEDWIPLFWHVCHCRALELLHIQQWLSQHILVGMAYPGPVKLQAPCLRDLTLEVSWGER